MRKYSIEETKIIRDTLPYGKIAEVLRRVNDKLVANSQEPVAYSSVRAALNGYYKNDLIVGTAAEIIDEHIKVYQERDASTPKSKAKSRKKLQNVTNSPNL